MLFQFHLKWNFCQLGLILFFMSTSSFAEIFNGGVVLTTQAEVDAFIIYTEVTGSLTLDGNDITNLNGLSNLTSVGFLLIYNTGLTNLDGLSNLAFIEVYLDISDNSFLINVDGLSNLSSVGGNFLRISGNASLDNLDGLSGIISYEKDLIIEDNSSLSKIGFPNLSSLGGTLQLLDNNSLTNIEGLSNLTSVGGSLWIYGNALTNLDGLSNLTSVGSILYIDSNPNLTSFCGLYTLLNGGGLTGDYIVLNNSVNPTEQDIIQAGPCYQFVCPFQQGYWKINNDWPADELMLGSQSYLHLELLNILNMPVGAGNRADASLILAKQLIAVKLNIENGADVPEDVETWITSSDNLIGGNYIPMNIHPKTELGSQMIQFADSLESYNKGELNGGCSLPKSEITEKNKLLHAVPTDFALHQNYPNPFNPATIISWQSPVGSWQTLKIYDLLGREITTLIDEYKPAGSYEVEFNASLLASGTYFYRLSAGSFTYTKKLLLMK
ncbi:MAG: T9SS type A sorting domain-containing protein [Ignavibacteriaceae bacterium]